ncbi:MAG: DUF4445 domain-containing protein [Vicinamibacteria bacterium]|nr:DUF4445 domain-containing protein [Vicinamibacteria bacterium]
MAKEEYAVDFSPLGRRALVGRGMTLLEAAHQAGVRLNAVCGGAGICGACRVRVVAGEVSPAVDAEAGIMADGFRLACQVRVLGDVRVDVPPESITAPQRVQIEGRESVVDFDPVVRVLDVTTDPPSLSDPRADSERLRQSLPMADDERMKLTFDRGALSQLPVVLRKGGWHVRVVMKGAEVIAVLPVGVAPLGLAVDVGTTKLAAYLVDLESGETLAAMGVMNPQIAYGDDVIARIASAMAGEAQGLELHRVLVEGLDGLAGDLCVQAGRDRGDVVEAVLAGNTCMQHLALGLPVSSLGLAPYVPVLSESYDLKARDLGAHWAPGASVHFLPSVAGFVGADHVAMILATAIHQSAEITLGLDIGTNTEIILAAGDRLLSCSCASGPAFEGAHIRDGMRAAPGAVERVRLGSGATGDFSIVEYQTIEDAPPVGICGSGLIDGVAVMLRAGVLRENGAMRSGHPRVRGSGRMAEFLLVPAGEREAPRDVAITRKDVQEVQLAKAAIRAGIEALLENAGLDAGRIERVVVAGAFGTYLDVDSALAIGMFPPLSRDRFVQAGNAAGTGSRMALVSRRCREAARDIASRIVYVELTMHPRFVELYAKALAFP